MFTTNTWLPLMRELFVCVGQGLAPAVSLQVFCGGSKPPPYEYEFSLMLLSRQSSL